MDVLSIQMILTGFTDQMAKLEEAAEEQKSTVEAIADLAKCGEIWHAIASRQEERDGQIACLHSYLKTRETSTFDSMENTKETNSYLQLLLREREQIDKILGKVLTAKYTLQNSTMMHCNILILLQSRIEPDLDDIGKGMLQAWDLEHRSKTTAVVSASLMRRQREMFWSS